MKKSIKLLLLAALLWPAIAMAQGQPSDPSEQVVRLDASKVESNHLLLHKSPDVAEVATKASVDNASVPKAPYKQVRKVPVSSNTTGIQKAPAMAPTGPVKAPPAGATIEEWHISTDWYDSAANTESSETGWVLGSFGYRTVNVAISGNRVYIQGLSKYVRDAWVEGTLNGTTVTFATGQLLGTDDQGRSHYFVGEWEQEVADVRFVYDASHGILTQYSEIGTDEDGEDYLYYTYINEGTTSDDLKGFGYHEGMVLMRVVDKQMKTLSAEDIQALADTPEGDLYHYKYPINVDNPSNEGTLLDVVEVKDELSAGHAIALLRAVYTNKYLPGPYTRGYTAAGQTEGTVSYAGVGTMSGNATRANTLGNRYYTYQLSNLQFNNSRGWNIPATESKFIKGTYPSGNANSTSSYTNNGYRYEYAYFDPTEYRPNDEGYTLLLVEMQDGFKTSDIWDANNNAYRVFSSDPYENLVQYVLKTIKSVRLLTEAKRTGTNVASGTLFKIDANKVNRFFIISKGQSRFYKNSYAATSQYYDFCDEPYLGLARVPYGYGYYNNIYNNYNDDSCEPIFYHMFEQFSPAMAKDGTAKSDIYKILVTGLDATGTKKTGFPVYHDCSTVPYAEAEKIDATTGTGKGHEFKMLADNEPLTNAPDVRDLLFFVPDYRLTYHTNTTFPDGTKHSRDNSVFQNDPTIVQKFVYYNQDYAPRMDMYVIHLNPIDGEQVVNNGIKEHVYQLALHWNSNMNSFLPAEEQVFTLYRIVTDANGSSEYEPVYRTNGMGLYVDANGNVLADQNDKSLRVPVTMQGIYSLNELDYYDYVPMDATGKEVTYAVRGQDTGGFLGLQYSNAESYLIPGYDKNVRMTLKIDSDNYSKFDLPKEQNNYWNEIAVANNKGTSVTANFLKKGTKIDFSRRDLNIENQDSVIVASALVTEKTSSQITVKMTYFDQKEFNGSKVDANQEYFTFSYPTGEQEGIVDFGDWKFYDNFQADVSKNEHPNRYVYRAFFHSAEPFDLDPDENGVVKQSYLVYSNVRGIKVYKTKPEVNGAFTLQDVLDDSNMGLALKEDDAKYKLELEKVSRDLLWRYEVCRWAEETTVPSTFNYYGHAQNNTETYSLSFGSGEYAYTVDNLPVTNETTVAEFEDKELKANGGAYDYVPQAVVFTKRNNDNNTYGAPRKVNAVGKLAVEVMKPKKPVINPNTQEVIEDYSLMSNYKWYDNDKGKWYSYYNIYLNFTALDVPEGYKLYKVRAWRKVEGGKDVLGEEVSTRESRAVDGWYMYEDMNFGDPLDMSGDPNKLMGAQYFMERNHVIGDRSNKIGKPVNPDGTGGGPVFEYDDTPNPNADNTAVENLIKSEMRATFGAKRLTTEELPTDFKTLDATFKVRAYFTKESNPLISNAPIYVVGDQGNGNGWSFTTPLATLCSEDGTKYEGTITVPDAGDGFGYFSFTNLLGDDANIKNHRFGVQWDNGEAAVNMGVVYNLICWEGGTKAIKVAAGTYKLAIDNYTKGSYSMNQQVGNIVITKASANAPRRAEEVTQMIGSDYDYYVAEGEATFSFTSDGSNIITGISGVKADLNREVVSVTYVNPLGQQSSRPFSGVNMVVTRYSDGSMSTTKVVK